MERLAAMGLDADFLADRASASRSSPARSDAMRPDASTSSTSSRRPPYGVTTRNSPLVPSSSVPMDTSSGPLTCSSSRESSGISTSASQGMPA